MMKAKIFNYRPLFYSFLCLFAGIIITRYLYENVLLSIILLLLFLGVIIFYSIYYHTFKFIIVALIFCSIGSIMHGVRIKSYNETENINVGDVIEASVESLRDQNSNTLIVEVLKINDNDADFNITLVCTNQQIDCSEILDNKIKFVVESYEKYNLKESENKDYILLNNLRGIVRTGNIEVLSENKKLNTKIRDKIKENLTGHLSNENVELMFSALFGDKSGLDDDLYTAYKATGIAHILAVSGLHVGLIASILAFILKLLKSPRLFNAIVITVFLICYCYLCDFSPSVVRATVMFTTLSWSAVFFREYDALSSLGLAGVIILLMNPMNAFNVSFLLSYSCILGINMFYLPALKLLRKLKINSKIVDSLVLSAIVNITITPVMVHYFTGVSYIGIILNVFILPVFSLVFSVIFVCAILSLILPFITYLITIFNPILSILNTLIRYVATFKIAILTNNISYLNMLELYILFMFISKYNIKRGNAKLLSILIVLIILALNLIFNQRNLF